MGFRSLLKQAIFLAASIKPLRRMMAPVATGFEGASIQRILYISKEGLGDNIMAAPAAALLRASFPAARITVYLSNPESGLFFRDQANEILASGGGLLRTVKKLRFLRRQRFDLCVVATATAKGGAMGLLVRPRHLILDADSDFSGFVTDPVRTTGHYVEKRLQLLTESKLRLGVSGKFPPARFSSRPEDRAQAQAFLAAHGIPPRARIVGVHIGCNPVFGLKRWPVENYAALISRLKSSDPSVCVVVFKGRGERNLSYRPFAELACAIADHLPLPVEAALLAHCQLVIGNDGGLGHVAATVGCATISLFGPTSEQAYRPWGERATVIRMPMPCAPCNLGPAFGKACDRTSPCMKNLGVEQVFSVVRDALLQAESPEGRNCPLP